MKKKTLIVSVSVLLILLCSLGYLLHKKIFADELSGSVVLKGRIFEDLSEYLGGDMNTPAPGAVLSFTANPDAESCNGQSCDTCQKEFSVTADTNGYYEIAIDKPCDCSYRVIAGASDSDGYNAKDYGYKWLKQMELYSMLGSGFESNYTVNRETDMMFSHYFGHLYTAPYQNSYHLSQWDDHYIRNNVSMDQILHPGTAEIASFKIPVTYVTGAWPMDEMTISSKLTVYPVLSNWNSNPPSVYGALAEKEFSFNRNTANVELEFSNIDLSRLSDYARNQVYVNGFMIHFEFNTDGVNPETVRSWYDVNPDIVIPASERSDNSVISPIEYGGVQEANEVCFRQSDTNPEVVSELNGYTLPGGGSGKISMEDHMVTSTELFSPQSLADRIADHLSITNFRANCPCTIGVCKISLQMWTPAVPGSSFGQGSHPLGSVPAENEPWTMNTRWGKSPAPGTKVLITSNDGETTRSVVTVAGYEWGPNENTGNLLGAPAEVLAALKVEHSDNVTFAFLKDQSIPAGTKYVSCNNPNPDTVQSVQILAKLDASRHVEYTEETIAPDTAADSTNSGATDDAAVTPDSSQTQVETELSYDGDLVYWDDGVANVMDGVDTQLIQDAEMIPIDTQISPEFEVLSLWDRVLNIFDPQPIEMSTQYNDVQDGWVYWEDGIAYSPADQASLDTSINTTDLVSEEPVAFYQDSFWERVEYLFDPMIDISYSTDSNIDIYSYPPEFY